MLASRLKNFFLGVITSFDEAKKTPSPSTHLSPLGLVQLPRDFMFAGNLAYLNCMEPVLKLLLLAQPGHARASPLKEELVGSILMKLYDFRTF